MTTSTSRPPTPLGELAASLLLTRLRLRGFRSSNRHIVDYLPSEVGEALFEALISRADKSISVRLPAEEGGERGEPMLAIHDEQYDILPYFVEFASRGAGRENRGTEGFASCLRDHYAVDAERPRLLVVVTPLGNETQKSAQDLLADEALITLELLLDSVLERANVPQESDLRAVAGVYRAHHTDETPWRKAVELFEAFVEQVASLPPEQQGSHLPLLGCFLPDSRPDFASGARVHVLEDKDQRQRQRGEGRLFDNALMHEFLTVAFADPIVDPEHVLADVFAEHPETAREISNGGMGGLGSLELRTFAGMDQRRQSRKKNALERSSLVVSGAAFSMAFGKDAETLIVVTASTSFNLTFKLARPFNDRKERAQVVTWSASDEKLRLQAVTVANGAEQVIFPLGPNAETGFSVCRVALTRGPRSLRNPIDEIIVVIYCSDANEIVVEEGRLASLEDQAWIAEGERRFNRYNSEGSIPLETADEEQIAVSRDDESKRVFNVLLDGSSLLPRVVDERPKEGEDEATDGGYAFETLLELTASTVRRGYITTQAMRSKGHYLDAVVEINEGAGRYKIDLEGGDTREVWAGRECQDDAFRYGRAVARLLQHPHVQRLAYGPDGWTDLPLSTEVPPPVAEFITARSLLLADISRLAEAKLPRYRRVPHEAAVPISLLSLEEFRPRIDALLCAWSEAVDKVITNESNYTAAHDVLLQTDTLRVLDSQGLLERLVVLPTSPWMLSALLEFQTRFAQNILSAQERRSNVQPSWQFELTREEVQQMVPRSALERWYIWQAHDREFELADSAPFHLEFLPERAGAGRAPLDYVGRVVATKIGRYLRMHPHLRNDRRTLRIGFVNAGTGEHLLAGLEQWLRNTMQEYAGRIRELPMENIPAIDLFLFSSDEDAEQTVEELERFFREQVSASDDNVIRQALLARIQYRYCKGKGPSSMRDAVHICFLHGLVDDAHRAGKTGQLAEWWDGGFGDGLLATYLRRALPGGCEGSLNSRRGLWIDPGAQGIRGALARTLALQRGCRDGDIAREKALYWESALPNISSLATIYDQSDWVVHLDRELSLEIFQQGPTDERPTIIEYSDQEVPESPGYDTITATKHATPYLEQLGEILTTADLDVSGRGPEARRAANSILGDINVLSGSWALDFLLGSIADQRTSMRLKGNVGAALVYRWLRRVELGSNVSATVETNVGPVVPVFVSLEDLLRATPAAGLSRKQGLVYRYTNEVEDKENKEAARWCDDLLILYLTPTTPGTRSRIFGRVIEVKFGKNATASQEKAVGQVRNTQQLLQERLAGSAATLDAPFRHKQLSLLVKTQLEQAVAMNVFHSDVYEFLNVPALSANLATGNYDVDYTISDHGQHLSGDAFLLHTALSDDMEIAVEVVEGVRVITVPRTLVEWLAFEPDDNATLTTLPTNTLPALGKYQDVQTDNGKSKRRATEARRSLSAPHHELASRMAAAASGNSRATVQLELALTNTRSVQNEAGADTLESKLPEVSADCASTTEYVVELALCDAIKLPIKDAPYSSSAVVEVVGRLERALVGHKIRLASSPSPRESERGPRLIRAYVRLEAGESIGAIRRISEDIARVVGTATSDIHVTNVPERHAVGIDLPIAGLTYSITFDELLAHPSFAAAQRDLMLGFCAGIDLTGLAVWADLADMPHMLVAGTTGSGKTVFLRNLILTLLLNHNPRELVLRLSSSKPMDFRAFMDTPHAAGQDMAREPVEALQLANALIVEMERRYTLIDKAHCDNLMEFNIENPDRKEPYIVSVFDEYAEMVSSFSDKQGRDAFESAIARLAQKSRAAGIHLVICMQRPDAMALKGAIKANILHRFALKLPQNQDSRIILDESGAETLLGQGDLLYKDANSRLLRLQVPFLENATLKRCLRGIHTGDTVCGPDVLQERTCPKCRRTGSIGDMFGVRRAQHTRSDGTVVSVERVHSCCNSCRADEAAAT